MASSQKIKLHISTTGNYIEINIIKHFENLEKRQYLQNYKSEKDVKGTIGNLTLPSLPGGSLEITLTVPLNGEILNWIKFLAGRTNIAAYTIHCILSFIFYSIMQR